MLKLDSMYKNNFPNNPDSRMRSPTNIPLLDNVGVYIDVVPLEFAKASDQASKIAVHINNIMSLPEEEYEDVWEVISLRLIVAAKVASDGVPRKQNHILSFP